MKDQRRCSEVMWRVRLHYSCARDTCSFASLTFRPFVVLQLGLSREKATHACGGAAKMRTREPTEDSSFGISTLKDANDSLGLSFRLLTHGDSTTD